MKKELTCIGCPMGCLLTAELESAMVTEVTGNACPRGASYARDELTNPTRMVTGLVRLYGSHVPLSVKTRAPIPKALIGACLAQLTSTTLTKPVACGEVVLENVCGCGVDVIATADAY